MAQSQTVLRRKDTTSNSALYISFDLGDKSWQMWAAAGLMDTWLRWKIKPEVVYGNEAAFQPGVQG
jgi:hypothetical protein